MNHQDIIRMAREAGLAYGSDEKPLGSVTRFAALVADHERDRICKAIKEEDDYCVTEGDYMLDSDDCIAIAKGDWVRPDYSATAIRARGTV
jgi:metal-responsive CopG/Arc/MetJ family transcriptional regulator